MVEMEPILAMEPLTMALLAGSIGQSIMNFFGGRSSQKKNVEWERERFYAALEDAQAARELNQRNYFEHTLPMWQRERAADVRRRQPMTDSVARLGPGINTLLGF